MNGIYIPEPCHENWGKMSPTEKGRFCKVCTKEVVDFTSKSKQEIIQHLTTAEGKTCGQFSVSQLDPTAQITMGKDRWNYRMKKVFFSMLTLLGIVGLSKKTEAQKMGKVAIRGDVAYFEEHNTNTSETTLSGQVKNSLGEVLANTEIEIYSNEELIAKTTTMANGTYLVKIAPKKIQMNKISLYASHADYSSKIVEDLAITKSNHRINFVMEEEIMMLGEVYYIPEEIDTTADLILVDTLTKSTNCSIIITDTTVSETQDSTEVNTPINIVIPETNTNDEQQNALIISEIREEDLNGKIYPNPGKERVNLVMNQKSNYKIEIVALSGQLIQTDEFTGTFHIIDISNYTPGIYIVKYADPKTGKSGALRLVKQ